MAISASDPYYRAEVIPASIAAMRTPLCNAFGVGATSFGAKGNLQHASGYHRSRAWVLNSSNSRYGSSDYSVKQMLDKLGNPNNVSAFDFTPGVWGTADNRQKMKLITRRVLDAARARDPRLSNMREFAGTIDGVNVITFNCADGSTRTPFDPSHLDHIHGSIWRLEAASDHTGIIQVMLGLQEDEMVDFNPADANSWAEARRVEAVFKDLARSIADTPATAPGGTYPGEENKLHTHLVAIDDAAEAQTVEITALKAAVEELTEKVEALSTGTGYTEAQLEAIVRRAIVNQGDDNPAT